MRSPSTPRYVSLNMTTFDHSQQPRRTRWIGNLLLAVISLAVTLGLAELVLRMMYVPPPIMMEGPALTKGEYFESDPILGWKPRNHVQGVHTIPGSFASTFHTNARGLRGAREFSFEKHQAARMVVVGDSFTWGWGVNDDDIYTAKLAALRPQMDVINLGVTAYGTSQELEYFKTEGRRYRPDVVLLAFCLNDIEEYEFQAIRRGASTEAVASQPPSMRSWKSWVSEHMYLYRFLIDRINTNKTLVNALVRIGLKGELSGYEALDFNVRPALRQYPPHLADQWERTKGQLRVIRDLARAQHARLILALIPSLQTVEPTAFAHTIAYTKYEPEDFDLDKPYRLLEEFGKEEQIEVLNPVASFRQAQAQRIKLYLPNDMHFTPAGHELFAKEIQRYLEQHPTATP